MKLGSLLAHVGKWFAIFALMFFIAIVVVIVARPSETNVKQTNHQAVDGQPKRLVLFLDGTWNSVHSNTNVWRMRALCAPHGADGKPQQVYYSIGVNGFLGGVFGQGLDENIRLAYEWLVENYNPGDEVFIFGFSRGAYTARSLAGLVAIEGILRPGSPIGIAELFERHKAGGLSIWKLEEIVSTGSHHKFTLQEKWLLKYSRPAKVNVVGVWDTVGSLGWEKGNIPGVSRSTFSYLQTGLRIHILNAYHALAIDEHRQDFAPTLWDASHSIRAKPRPLTSVEQRWFVGAHANVGGGYPTDLLAQAPLQWMMQKAEVHGLTFRSDVELDGDIIEAPIADSHSEFAYGFYSIFSKKLNRLIGREPYSRGAKTYSTVNETIDATVFERWRADPSYRPANLVEWARRKGVDPGELKGSVRADNPRIPVSSPALNPVVGEAETRPAPKAPKGTEVIKSTLG